MSSRRVDRLEGWIELTPQFIEDIKIGVVPGWRYINEDVLGECVVYVPVDGEPQAWHIKRDRVLGEPVPIFEAAVGGSP